MGSASRGSDRHVSVVPALGKRKGIEYGCTFYTALAIQWLAVWLARTHLGGIIGLVQLDLIQTVQQGQMYQCLTVESWRLHRFWQFKHG